MDSCHEDNSVKYAYYSAQGEAESGSSVYLTPSGKEVVVSGIYLSKESGDRDYQWPDKVYVGEVTKWVRKYKLNQPLEAEFIDPPEYNND